MLVQIIQPPRVEQRPEKTYLGIRVALDCWDEPSGDAFACRYEAYITDPRTEPRKTKWEVELNMRVA
jgi:hypothetical protein